MWWYYIASIAHRLETDMKVQVLIRLEEPVKNGLDQLAEAENRSVSNYLETLILKEMEKQTGKAA